MTALRIDPRDGEGGVGTGGVTLSTGNSNKDDGGPGALDLVSLLLPIIAASQSAVHREPGARRQKAGNKKMRVWRVGPVVVQEPSGRVGPGF